MNYQPTRSNFLGKTDGQQYFTISEKKKHGQGDFKFYTKSAVFIGVIFLRRENRETTTDYTYILRQSLKSTELTHGC